MSKIGMRAIAVGLVKIDINGQTVNYAGKNTSGMYVLPHYLQVVLRDSSLYMTPKEGVRVKTIKNMWGLHRSLLANKIQGSVKLFENKVQITGMGYKAVLKGSMIEFSLGFSHKIDFPLPPTVTLEIDKTGQLLTFKSFDKELVGQVCGMLRRLKPTEPYKGTGIRLLTDVIIRKAGKTK